MRSEANTSIDQRFLMILGRVSNDMIRQTEERSIPNWMDRLKKRGDMDTRVLDEYERFSKRNKTLDRAYYTLYAYADIPVGHTYNCLFHKDGGSQIPISGTIAFAIFEGMFPVTELAQGHKHLVFLNFEGNAPGCIPAYDTWEDIGKNEWQYGLCDQASYSAIETRRQAKQIER
jgi:hypothetical protein